MKWIYKLLVNGGKFIVIYIILLVSSISLVSFTTRGKVNYGNRCNSIINDEIIENYDYKNVELLSNYLGCNTYYLEYNSNLTKKENLLFLASISKLLSDNNLDVDVHVIINCDNYQIMATIVDYNISYIESVI